MHVAVGTDAGIAEEIPCSANRVTALKDGVALARALLTQVAGRADARQARADDDDVNIFGVQGSSVRNSKSSGKKLVSSALFKNATPDEPPVPFC